MKRYESDRILGLSVTINGSTILFINVYFCEEIQDAKYRKYRTFPIMKSVRNISCVLVYLVPYLNHVKRIMYA